ncbi:winged helix-turn-helix transcriptional regulator [Nonomuraea sp. NPDC050536]|uniref:winged helix-turn-helix transcriptional regulator n=1 Tax=Nonomuraea sp. NPDC050536 TaxID=3364366 RepID=UPI0037C5C55D
MTTPRTYGDPCALTRALDVIGERWALVIVRELLFGPKRYSDLQGGLPNASPTVLAQRLKELEGADVIQRRKLGPPARAWVYELTDWGRELEPILVRLGHWGRRTPRHDAAGMLSTDSLMLALESHLDLTRLGGLTATYLVDLGEDLFTVRLVDGALAIRREEPAHHDAAVRTDPTTFKALVIEGRPAGELGGRLTATGDLEALDRLLGALSD